MNIGTLTNLQEFGIATWQQLLAIAESANPPAKQPSDSPDWCADATFPTDDGWQVVIFYDCGELDYIECFITPTGAVLDFWIWPDGHPWKEFLRAWRGVGDLARLSTLDTAGAAPGPVA